MAVSGSSIRKLAMAPLPPLKQPAGKAIGFFEQGLRSGAVALVGVLAAVGYGIWIFGWTGAQVAELKRWVMELGLRFVVEWVYVI
jgi:hypothetical protein